MHPYILETEYAVRNLIELAVAEENTLCQERAELDKLAGYYQWQRWDFETSDLNDDFTEMYVMAAFGRMTETHRSMQQVSAEVSKLEEAVAAHEASVQAVCGSIVQIAKQGISTVYGGQRTKAPPGRSIGSLELRDIIWQGRNQAIHYEDNKFKPPVVDCFAALEKEQGEQFSLTKHVGQNRARQVVHLLGWTTYDEYQADMSSLLP